MSTTEAVRNPRMWVLVGLGIFWGVFWSPVGFWFPGLLYAFWAHVEVRLLAPRRPPGRAYRFWFWLAGQCLVFSALCFFWNLLLLGAFAAGFVLIGVVHGAISTSSR